MTRSQIRPAPGLPLGPLAAGLALALMAGHALGQTGFTSNHLQATPAGQGLSGPVSQRQRAAAAGSGPIGQPSATTYEVSSCGDDGSPGTLRAVIGSASDGDTVDMSLLTCSTITLAAGQILVPQNTLYIQASPGNPITIDAASTSRVIEHYGNGLLQLEYLEVTNGTVKYDSSAVAFGGCIASLGYVSLKHATASNCHAISTGGPAFGGALFAEQYITLDDSIVSASSAMGVDAEGGGVWSYGLHIAHSSISGNNASSTINDPAHSLAEGGGFLSKGEVNTYQATVSDNQASSTYGFAIGGAALVVHSAMLLESSTISGNSATSPASNGGGIALSGTDAPHYILYSTIDHNASVNNSALVFYGTSTEPNTILSSTISGNTATTGSSAIFASNPLYIYNSTLAFNVSAGSCAGLYLYSGGNAIVESTIIANNTSSSGGGFDIVARAPLSGSHDLIQNPGSAVPGDTITGVDPLLEPLANNGRTTRTHALDPTSAAIDFGFNPIAFAYDQRGAPRVFGVAADIGAYEWQGENTDTIFADGFD